MHTETETSNIWLKERTLNSCQLFFNSDSTNVKFSWKQFKQSCKYSRVYFYDNNNWKIPLGLIDLVRVNPSICEAKINVLLHRHSLPSTAQVYCSCILFKLYFITEIQIKSHQDASCWHKPRHFCGEKPEYPLKTHNSSDLMIMEGLKRWPRTES